MTGIGEVRAALEEIANEEIAEAFTLLLAATARHAYDEGYSSGQLDRSEGLRDPDTSWECSQARADLYLGEEEVCH
ncbi:MAG: hypothetical protein ACLFSR_03780 [Halomonas sp.]